MATLKDNNGATGKIIISFYDCTRQLVAPGTRVLLTVTDGNKRTVFRDFVQGTTVTMDVPFFNNFGDQYTVLASPDKGLDAGFFPVMVSPTVDRPVFLMFLPNKNESEFNFAPWKQLQQHSPRLVELFSQGGGDLRKAQQRYEDLMEHKSAKTKGMCLKLSGK